MRSMPGSQHPAGTGVGSRPVRDPAADQHPMRAHPPTYSGSPVGDVTAFDRNMTAEDAMVHDTLCAMQAPTGLVRLTRDDGRGGPAHAARRGLPPARGQARARTPAGRRPRHARRTGPHPCGRAAWSGAFCRDDARPAARQGLVRRLAQAGAVRAGLLAGLPGRRTAGRGDAPGDLRRRHARSTRPPGHSWPTPSRTCGAAHCAGPCCSPSTPSFSSGSSRPCRPTWPTG